MHHLRSLLILLPFLALATPSPAAAPTDFQVQTPGGERVFRLSEARGKFVVLHFLLKTECPICQRHTREYAEKGADWKDVAQVFLKPDDETEVKRWTQKLDAATQERTSVYRDPEARLAEAFGIPGGYEFHGEKVHYPALIVLDRAGKEIYRHVGRNNTDRVPFATLAAKLEEWRRNP